jgi:NADH-quinone oxidoreductase subunit L
MFLGAGVGAYATGMFHLMTHAFFKALLFMAAGVVIHALSGEQDIRRMGGLARAMPRTHLAFLIVSLALVGIPPFAGFFSKDSILAALTDRGGFGYVLLACGLWGTFLTGLYTFRLYFIVFRGEQSAFAKEHLHLHGGQEGALSMRWTVAVLAGLSVVGGLIQFAPFWHSLTTWLEPVAAPIAEATNRAELLVSLAAVLLGLAGMAVAYALYEARTMRVPKAVPALERKLYWDELYDRLTYRPADLAARAFARFVEGPLIAGSIGEITRGFRLGGTELGRVQNGLVRSYVLALASGIAVLVVVFLAAR